MNNVAESVTKGDLVRVSFARDEAEKAYIAFLQQNIGQQVSLLTYEGDFCVDENSQLIVEAGEGVLRMTKEAVERVIFSEFEDINTKYEVVRFFCENELPLDSNKRDLGRISLVQSGFMDGSLSFMD